MERDEEQQQAGANPVDLPSSPTRSADDNIHQQDGIEEKQDPHDDNLRAYLQIFGAFFCTFNSWGLANTFGEFQAFYQVALLSQESPSRISWIGSLQALLLLLVGGLCTGPIYDAGNLRGLVVAGTIFTTFGMMMTSICTQYWQFILAQGIVVGIGMGCLLLPAVTPISQYFTARRALATGIAASGSSLGGVLYPIIFHKLQPRIGFGWATRTMGLIVLVTLIVPIVVMRAKSYPATRRPLVDTEVLRDVPYTLFTIGQFFAFMGLYIPFYYISTFCAEMGLVDANLGFYLLTIINAASVFGRIIPNYFADTIGSINTITPCTMICGVIAFCWTTLSSTGAVVVFCLFYGFFSGTYVAIVGPALVALSPNMAFLGTHMGMAFAFGSLGLLLGNPVAGLLLDDAGWIGPAAWCGAANLLATFFMLLSRYYKVGFKLMVRI